MSSFNFVNIFNGDAWWEPILYLAWSSFKTNFEMSSISKVCVINIQLRVSKSNKKCRNGKWKKRENKHFAFGIYWCKILFAYAISICLQYMIGNQYMNICSVHIKYFRFSTRFEYIPNRKIYWLLGTFQSFIRSEVLLGRAFFILVGL